MNGAAKIVLGIIVGVLSLLALTLFGGGALVMGPMMRGFGYGPGGMMYGGYGSWWVLVPILFWVGLLALIVWSVTRVFPKNRSVSGDARRDPAEEILRERFARGDVDREEYERALETLTKSVPHREHAPG